MISRANYQEWIVDYVDGHLDIPGQRRLFEFLEQNPDLKVEFLSFENVTLPDITEVFSFKDELKKLSGLEGNLDELLIAELEGDLAPLQIAELENRAIKEPNVAKYRRLYQHTRVKPSKYTYPAKRQLKKGAIPFIPFKYYAAASAIIVMISWLLLRPDNQESEIPKQISSNQKLIKSPITKPAHSEAVDLNSEHIRVVKADKLKSSKKSLLPSMQNKETPINPSPVEQYVEVDDLIKENLPEPKEFIDVGTGVSAIAAINIDEPVYNKVEQILRNEGEKKLAKITGDEAIAKTVINSGENKNTRLVKLATWASGRFTGGRIGIIPQEDFEGNITAVVLTAPGVEVYRTLK